MIRIETRNGTLPALGFGTWALSGDDARRMVAAALAHGYRHVDTAAMYANEREVGRGIADSGVAREDVFLTTKIWPDDFRPADLERSVARSLDYLGVDAVDLLLLHWPNPSVPLERTLDALMAARDAGRTRHIGVSNFNTALMGEADRITGSTLLVNQVEYHPFVDQGAVLGAARELGLGVVAYSPLARGDAAGDATLADVGRAHGKSATQVALRWLVQQPNVGAIPRSSSETRMAENFAIFDFELSDAEMARVAALANPAGRRVDPAGLAPDWD